MTDEYIKLAKRAVACKHWRWIRGMLRQDEMRYVGSGVWARWSDTALSSGVLTALHSPDQWPDLSESATRGCLLALVREAWGDPTLCVVFDTSDGRWHVGRWEDGMALRGREGDTEAEALVDALESAPPTH